MSYGDFCKHCRAYKERHIDSNCPNGKFELFVDEKLEKMLAPLLNAEKERKEKERLQNLNNQIANDLRRGVIYK